MVFLEHDVDHPQGSRLDRWRAAYGSPGTVYLPLVMVDSGYRYSNGSEDFYPAYKAMVEDALTRPPQARLAVERQRLGDAFRFDVSLTNLGQATLGAANSARLHAVVYEDAHVADTDRFVRAAGSVAVSSLAPGETGSFTLEVAVGTADWSRLHSVVLVDCRPGGATGAYDMLQAALQP